MSFLTNLALAEHLAREAADKCRDKMRQYADEQQKAIDMMLLAPGQVIVSTSTAGICRPWIDAGTHSLNRLMAPPPRTENFGRLRLKSVCPGCGAGAGYGDYECRYCRRSLVDTGEAS